MKIAGIFFKHKFLLFFMASLLLYANTLKNGYGLDDNMVTRKGNITTQGFKSIKTIFTTHYVVEEGGVNTFEYRPVVKLAFALEHQFFGVRPAVSHFINLFLYAICLLVLYKVLKNILAGTNDFFLISVVLFFATIPVHTEVVAGLKSRDILLCFIFSFSAFNAMYHYISTKKIKFLALGFVLMLTAFLSKLDALPYIVLFPLLLFKNHPEHKKAIMMVFAALVLSYISFDTLMNLLIDNDSTKRPLELYENLLYVNKTPALVLTTALNTVGFYSIMLFFPKNMACYYGFDTIPVTTLSSFYAIIGILTAIVLSFLFVQSWRRKNPVVLTGILFYAFPIAMFSNIVKPVPGIVGDRFLFFASVGFSLLIVYALFKAGNKLLPAHKDQVNTLSKIILVSFILMNCYFVITRNMDWKNEITLYTADVNHQPASLKLNNLCGNGILADLASPQGTIPDNEKAHYVTIADTMLKRVVAKDPKNIKALNNLSFLNISYYKNYEATINYSLRAYAIDSTKFEVIYNLAVCYYNMENYVEAEKYAVKAYNLKPDNNAIHELLSYIYSNDSKINDGIAFFTKKFIENRNNKKVNLVLANLYLLKKDTIQSLDFYKNALELAPTDAQLIEIINLLSKR